ncbi:hypothetical protein RSOLAG1IB_02392 [Rhizoctonia solani AG-1 IB]|uniref:B12D domain-containing protein n=1 Tax=Thanatephorus cucumeris (strain AG1-IB / isolate 7/3/14) TaxID=1108050 RepID=M5BJI9_THACB|nr:hypothetical protein BN14_00856 [Rhizoctonia solani AG-1 IB]CEL57649.1 hypothetical protein RSOLAG1IB_02392 [Rhizoctonia solani AG-1 IB]
MMLQRATPAFRQVTRQTIGRRMESAGAQASSDPNRKAKLVFRFGPRDVPVELWPMGAVVGAGVVGAGFAISRHFYKDEDLRLQRSVPSSK